MQTRPLLFGASVIVLSVLAAKVAAPGATDSAVAPSVLRAQRIELVDERGIVRARLNTESNGEVMLRLMNQQGEIRVKLGASSEGSGLILMNDLAQPGVHMLAQPAGATVTLTDRDNRQRVITPQR
jgi:hypothetical protein